MRPDGEFPGDADLIAGASLEHGSMSSVLCPPIDYSRASVSRAVTLLPPPLPATGSSAAGIDLFASEIRGNSASEAMRLG